MPPTWSGAVHIRSSKLGLKTTFGGEGQKLEPGDFLNWSDLRRTDP
jgi:hypothetical protein